MKIKIFYWWNKIVCKKKKLISYSNFKILVSFIWPLVQAGDSWTLRRVDHLLPSREGQGKGKWEFAPNASRVFLLICHNITPDQFGINDLKKKKNLKWNLTEGTDLQVNVSKAKVICLCGNRINFSSQSRHKFSRKKKT